jgi:uncharacterized LabA/DUF88 family protein
MISTDSEPGDLANNQEPSEEAEEQIRQSYKIYSLTLAQRKNETDVTINFDKMEYKVARANLFKFRNGIVQLELEASIRANDPSAARPRRLPEDKEFMLDVLAFEMLSDDTPTEEPVISPYGAYTKKPYVSPVRKRERVYAAIDGDNMFDYFSSLKVVSPASVIDILADGREMLAKPAYFASVEIAVYKNESFRRDNYAWGIQESGYFDLHATQIKIHHENCIAVNENNDEIVVPIRKRGYGDIDVCIPILENLENFDTLMLFTHDNHFAKFIQFLQSIGKKVEVYHYGIAGKQLREAANSETDMSTRFEVNYSAHIYEMIKAAKGRPWD